MSIKVLLKPRTSLPTRWNLRHIVKTWNPCSTCHMQVTLSKPVTSSPTTSSLIPGHIWTQEYNDNYMQIIYTIRKIQQNMYAYGKFFNKNKTKQKNTPISILFLICWMWMGKEKVSIQCSQTPYYWVCAVSIEFRLTFSYLILKTFPSNWTNFYLPLNRVGGQPGWSIPPFG
mgnify:CR=1 FL=1